MHSLFFTRRYAQTALHQKVKCKDFWIHTEALLFKLNLQGMSEII